MALIVTRRDTTTTPARSRADHGFACQQAASDPHHAAAGTVAVDAAARIRATDIPSSSWLATALSAAPVPVEVHM